MLYVGYVSRLLIYVHDITFFLDTLADSQPKQFLALNLSTNHAASISYAKSIKISTSQEELEDLSMIFYKQLFTTQDHVSPEEVIRYAPSKVTAAMNALLDAPFTAAEIEKALFMMHPHKSPGPDGFTAGFFQRHWSLIGPDVCSAMVAFLNGGDMPDIINTVLVQIPKVKNPQELSQFRPIALCNVLYKICSKTIANRLSHPIFRGKPSA
jgi:hypothetical protein